MTDPFTRETHCGNDPMGAPTTHKGWREDCPAPECGSTDDLNPRPIFAYRDGECPRPFALHREADVTGVSGDGTVAYGAQFADGTVVIRWLGDYASTVVWDDLDKAMHVHGHRGSTCVVWLAEQVSDVLSHRDELVAEVERLRANHQADIFRLEQWRTDVTATSVKLRAEIEAFADVLVRGSGSVPAADVAWKLRQILGALDPPTEAPS